MDKEKFRKEVEKLKSQLLRGACSSQIVMETCCKEEAYNEVLSILDTMQEEHVNRTTADVESAMQEVEEKSRVFTEAHKGEDADTILSQMRGEEPVGEDLGEYIDKLSKQFPEVSFAKLSRIAVRVAKWQKQQDQSTIELAEDHAMLAGMEKMKEEMMAKAIVGKVIANGMGNPILHLWDKGKHLIDKKVKVILIKED